MKHHNYIYIYLNDPETVSKDSKHIVSMTDWLAVSFSVINTKGVLHGY